MTEFVVPQFCSWYRKCSLCVFAVVVVLLLERIEILEWNCSVVTENSLSLKEAVVMCSEFSMSCKMITFMKHGDTQSSTRSNVLRSIFCIGYNAIDMFMCLKPNGHKHIQSMWCVILWSHYYGQWYHCASSLIALCNVRARMCMRVYVCCIGTYVQHAYSHIHTRVWVCVC